MVGHTHEDIVQVFSIVYQKLRKGDIITIDELGYQTKEPYCLTPKIMLVESIDNIKTWLPFLHEETHRSL